MQCRHCGDFFDQQECVRLLQRMSSFTVPVQFIYRQTLNRLDERTWDR